MSTWQRRAVIAAVWLVAAFVMVAVYVWPAVDRVAAAEQFPAGILTGAALMSAWHNSKRKRNSQ